MSGQRPNIIAILSDDQGYGDFSCHGNPILKTPNLDRLHDEGVRFTDFHVTPTCAPTRSALNTGRHEFRNGVTHTIFERERLTLSATTLAQVLQGSGYTTGIFGKWHLGDEAEYQPNRRGFDEVFIHGAGGIGQTYVGSCGDAPGNTYFNPAIWGTSEWSAQQIVEAHAIARREHLIPPLMEQPEYNMFHRQRVEKEYARLYTEYGLGTTIWSPLDSGLLTGKYNQGLPEGTRATLNGYDWLRKYFESDEARANIEKVKELTPIATDLGCTMAQLAIAWCLNNPNVSTVITGASRREQVIENMKALEIVKKLDAGVLESIENILNNKPEPRSKE